MTISVKHIFFIFIGMLLWACEQNVQKKDNLDVAEHLLNEKYADSIAKLDSTYQPVFEIIDDYFNKLHQKTQFYGTILYVDKGYKIIEKAYGYLPKNSDDILTLDHTFQLASVSKTFTSVAILMLYEQGKLNLTDTVQKFLPDFPYKGITIHHLLSHRSGLGKYDHFCDNPDTVWQDKTCSIFNYDVLEIIKNITPPVISKPDKRFYYTNTNYILLSNIIEEAAGMSYEHFIKTNIFEPLGMVNSVVYYRENKDELIKPVIGYEGNFRPSDDIYLNGTTGDKGIYSNTSDLLKFDQALYTEQLLKNETLELAFTGYSKPEKTYFNKNYGYGFRLMEMNHKGKIVYHTGWWKGFRTYFVRLVDKQQTVIVLSNVKRGNFFKIEELVQFLP
jgi:CubicO group peptidase (beta-lactamase class C family)